ncbi:DNA-processing protein DprA [Streptomyces sp. NPDC004546]|uniref:DNA-processing protein DprA n=1 Tax=Streptomyces sp. NPDC004546 TaxID=3154282 RepID=UPI0033BEDE0E
MPSTALSERTARAALAAHFSPHQVATHLAHHPAEDVWQYGVDHDASTPPAVSYWPREELANAQLTDRPLGLWVRGHEQLPQLTTRAVAVTGNRAATAEALTRTQAFATAVAEAGHTVTTTLAYGIDSAAHRAAAQARRPMLAAQECRPSPDTAPGAG